MAKKKKTTTKKTTKKKVIKKQATEESQKSGMPFTADLKADPSATGAVPTPIPEVVPEVREPRLKAKCDYCGRNKIQAWAECDPEWELPDHLDHIFRSVCESCSGDVEGRYNCGHLVFEAMRAALISKGMGHHEIESAVHIAWRSFHVELDVKALVKVARQLKVKHPWLKGKASK